MDNLTITERTESEFATETDKGEEITQNVKKIRQSTTRHEISKTVMIEGYDICT
jgi:hypothetical protein